MPVSKGVIPWMVNNRVTPNLLMIVLLLGGFLVSTTIKQEVFPEFELDLITVSVAYPGASPEEVEQSVVLALEQAVAVISLRRCVRAGAAARCRAGERSAAPG